MELFSQAASVVFVFCLLGAALWWLNRRNMVNFTGLTRTRKSVASLEAIERLRLTAQHSIHVVRFKDQTLLIGVHSSGCTLLGTYPLTPTEKPL